MLKILLIAIALSMDTFSLSLSLGTFGICKKNIYSLSSLVAVFHFFMPLLGIFIGNKIISILNIDEHFLLGIVLILIGIEIIIELLKNKHEVINLTLIGMLLFAFVVSFDSFSTGLGLMAITSKILLTVITFAITSFIFTLIGLYIGKFANKHLGIYAQILGLIILLSLGVYYVFIG